MKRSGFLKKSWDFLREDSWQSWVVSIILAFVLIRFVFFPLLSFLMGTPLPLVVVESCSMYHSTDFDDWWGKNRVWYEDRNIERGDFESFSFRNGLNKGDIVLVSGRGGFEIGEVIIFNADFRNPLIHRIVEDAPLATKGDNNPGQLEIERDISEGDILGRSVTRIPFLGWAKLIFFEALRSPEQRGFCN